MTAVKSAVIGLSGTATFPVEPLFIGIKTSLGTSEASPRGRWSHVVGGGEFLASLVELLDQSIGKKVKKETTVIFFSSTTEIGLEFCLVPVELRVVDPSVPSSGGLVLELLVGDQDAVGVLVLTADLVVVSAVAGKTLRQLFDKVQDFLVPGNVFHREGGSWSRKNKNKHRH